MLAASSVPAPSSSTPTTTGHRAPRLAETRPPIGLNSRMVTVDGSSRSPAATGP